MTIAIVNEGPGSLPVYASIPITYDVRSVFAVEPSPTELRGFRLTEEPLAQPVVKDYDAEPGNAPMDWPSRFDIRRWGFLSAHVAGERVGGAVVIAREAEVEMLEGRDDLAILWDLRVAPAYRRRGAGASLVRSVENWVRSRGGTTLKVETQNVNVPACRFYARHGFVLWEVNHGAYPRLPAEVQLIWYKSL